MTAVTLQERLDTFLGRLEGVRQIAPNRWIARCGAHEDKSPSLSVRLVEDRILVKCFGGCDAIDVVNAVGLELSDLFEGRPEKHSCGPARPNHWHAARDALRVLSTESLIVAIAGENIANGIALSDDDRDRVFRAANRIRAAREATE